jgi:hypothetical protein
MAGHARRLATPGRPRHGSAPDRLRRGGKRPKRKPSAKAAFAQVNVIGGEIASAAVMTVALRGGHSVSFEGPAVDPRWLEAVLKVVAAC